MKQDSTKSNGHNTASRKKRHEGFRNQQTKIKEAKLMMEPGRCQGDAVRRIVRIVLCDIRNNPEFLKHFATQDDTAFLQIQSKTSAEDAPRQSPNRSRKRKRAKLSAGRQRRRAGSAPTDPEATGCSSDDDFDFPVFRDNRLWLTGEGH